MAEIALVGCGPWGLAVLERLIAHITQLQISTVIHVIEPEEPGVGVYSPLLPDYLLLNTMVGQIDLFGSKFLNGSGSPPYRAMSFYEWLQENHYTIDDYGQQRAIQPTDFLPRLWLGKYLNWVYRTLLANVPTFIMVKHYPHKAVDIVTDGKKELITLNNGETVIVDCLFLTIGHADSVKFDEEVNQTLPRYPISAFPYQHVNKLIQPGDRIIVTGMGLTALDVITYLTIGRGGRFIRTQTGALEYLASGAEPEIIQCSRSGLPFLSRPAEVIDNAGSYKPFFLTKDKVDQIKAEKGPCDFRQDILPLLWKEMKAVYYQRHATLLGQDITAWLNKYGDASFQSLERRYGTFDPEQLFWGPRGPFWDCQAYQTIILEQIKQDIVESKLGEALSPTKSAIELIRIVRDIFRYAADFDGLSECSFADFRDNILPLCYRAVVGPPVHKMEELCGLVQAGIVKYTLGPDPEITFIEGKDVWLAKSRCLKIPFEQEIKYVISGHIGSADPYDSPSQLLKNLLANGRVAAFKRHVGIDIDTDFHPINRWKQAETNIYVLGLLTDGKRNFNLYIPSPRSRLQAFIDADRCVLNALTQWKFPVDLQQEMAQ